MTHTLSKSLLALAVASASLAQAEQQQDPATLVIQGQAPGYLQREGVTANKSNTPIADTPYSIDVISAEQIADTGSTDIQQALTYSAGVFAGQFGVDSRADLAEIRGASSSTYQDGLRTDHDFYNRTRIEPYSLERLEVLKGPASSLYGQGNMGGIIAATSKTPTGEEGGEIWLQAGNNNRKQVALDTQGNFDEQGDISYRFVGLLRDSDTQVDHVDDNRQMLNPSIKWQIGEDTSLTAIGLIQRDQSGTSLQFLPQSHVLPRADGQKAGSETFLAHPDFDKYDTATNSLTLKLEHAFNDTWSLNSNFRYLDGNGKYNTQYPIPDNGMISAIVGLSRGALNQASATTLYKQLVPGDNVIMLSQAQERDLESIGWDSQLIGNLKFGESEHEVLAGIDIGYNKLDRANWEDRNSSLGLIQRALTQAATARAAAAAGNLAAAAAAQAELATIQTQLQSRQINPFNPQPNLPQVGTLTQAPTNTVKQQGIYLQDNIKYQNWRFNGAVRWTNYSNSLNDGSQDTSGDKTSGRLGAMYKFNNGISPYLSVATAFNPQSGTTNNGDLFSPLESKQVEAGVKIQPQGSNWSLNAAVYKIIEENRNERDPNNPLAGANLELDEVTIKGGELELRGTWNKVTLLANYTYTDAKITEDSNGLYQDTVLFGTPKHQASVFGKYQFTDRFAMGLGARYTGSTSNGFPGNSAAQNDSFTLVDAMASYDIEDWNLSVNVRNLADKEYLASCSHSFYCYYGERRSILLNAKYQF